jgi:hypothetical protein
VADPAQKGNVMKRPAIQSLFLMAAMLAALWADAPAQGRDYFLTGADTQKYAVILAGAGADENYQNRFRQWAVALHKILVREYAYPPHHITLLAGRDDPGELNLSGPCRRETILDAMERLRRKVQPGDQVSIFFIGHGTSDDLAAKFVVTGPDISGAEFAKVLKDFSAQDIAVVNTTSSSHPFCASLSAPGRVVVCATRSAAERYDTVFARFLLEALENHAADRDKNQRVSLFELFVFVRERVKSWYTEQNRLPSEHPALNDNGDGRFHTEPDPERNQGRLAQIAEIDTLAALLPDAVAEGPSADVLRRLTARIQALERSVIMLRHQKAKMPDQDYRQQLELLLIDLARSSRRLKFQRAEILGGFP